MMWMELTVLSLNLMHIILANDVYTGGLESGIKIALECHIYHLLFLYDATLSRCSSK